MKSTKEIINKIEELRQSMYQIINEKQALTDAELVELSQEIDKLLNEYNKLIAKNI